ncbi:DUF6113 family protein [Nonomuraea cavernae]|uniref:Integral membrane protein n=1 Tax=Nonomuraea cavernae TaxID=2045107 RepID=A0A918DJH4_9ACTN|nr:DUF6113 family protein [Nonomuraea cavernae]MCA2186727.1 DUF6113 family protein [Nonomuraea cavernae]GGO67766.1 hypothetical protein GCM10012289_25010 [Nonomuraea cavernae]
MEQRSQAESALGGAAYGMLFVLGLVMGVVGGFTQDAWNLGPFPAAAVAWVVGLFGVCVGAGRLMRARMGAAVTAAGWLLVSMPFSLQLSQGDLVIAGGAAGYSYLYGGMLALVAAFFLSPSTSPPGSWLLRGHP